MNDESTLVALSLDAFYLEDDVSESASASAIGSIDTPTRAPPAEEIPHHNHTRSSNSLLSKDTKPISDELDRMLSLTQTISFWDDNNDTANHKNVGRDQNTVGETFDEDAATFDDEDSYDENSIASWDTEDDRRRMDRGLLACGEFAAAVGNDASNVFLESLADTTRLLSLTKLSLDKARSKLEMKFLNTTKEEKKRKREEQRRCEREEKAREEMRAARDEAGVLAASLWRER